MEGPRALTVWMGDDPDDLRRVRNKSAASIGVPRSERVLEVVCTRAAGRPHLIAVVHPRGSRLELLQVETVREGTPLGSDVAAPCPCGLVHSISGTAIRSAAMAAAENTRGRAAAIVDVSSVVTSP